MILKPTDVARADTRKLAREAWERARLPPRMPRGSTDARQTAKEWVDQHTEIGRAHDHVDKTETVCFSIIEKYNNPINV